MNATPEDLARLFHEVDVAPQQRRKRDDWDALLKRVDTAIGGVAALVGGPVEREEAQDAEYFIGVRRSDVLGGIHRRVFALWFSSWGDLVCIYTDLDGSPSAPLFESLAEILTSHGFVPVDFYQAQTQYTGDLYNDALTAPDASERTWFWRFFEHH